VAPSSEVFPKAKANAVKALELDETAAAAHNALAVIHILYDWVWWTPFSGHENGPFLGRERH
jgi:hypothetical protein